MMAHLAPGPDGTPRLVLRPWPCLGEYEYRYNPHADEDDRGGHVAWEVWHWPTETVDSDWFTASDAAARVVELHREAAAITTNGGRDEA